MSNENQLKFFIITLMAFIMLSFWFLGNPAAQKKMENADNNFINKIITQKPDKNSDEPDFSSYMKKLQQKIKRNWNPPKGNRSTRVVMLFKVIKSGDLVKYKIIQSSGDKNMDSAAVKSLKQSAPFAPLPKEFKGKSIDIQFTFDYNVHPKQRFRA